MVTAEEMLRAGTMLREAGLDLWAMILLGLDGHGAGSNVQRKTNFTDAAGWL